MPKWVDRLIAGAVWKEVKRKMPWLQRLIPNNIAGIIGVVQALIPLVRELLIVVVRILAIVMPGKVSEALIVKVSGFFTSLESGVNAAKNVLLK